jgi:hypothetical protein
MPQPIEYELDEDWDYERDLAYYDDSGYLDEQIDKLGHGIYLADPEDDEQN